MTYVNLICTMFLKFLRHNARRSTASEVTTEGGIEMWLLLLLLLVLWWWWQLCCDVTATVSIICLMDLT